MVGPTVLEPQLFELVGVVGPGVAPPSPPGELLPLPIPMPGDPPTYAGGERLRLVVDWANEGRGGVAAPNLQPDVAHVTADLGGGLQADITPHVRSIDCRLGRSADDPLESTDQGGSLSAVLDNRGGLFDPLAWRGNAGTEPKPGRAVMLVGGNC